MLLVGLEMLGGIVFGLRSLGWSLVYLVILCASVLAGLVGLLLALCLRFVAVNGVVSYRYGLLVLVVVLDLLISLFSAWFVCLFWCLRLLFGLLLLLVAC